MKKGFTLPRHCEEQSSVAIPSREDDAITTSNVTRSSRNDRNISLLHKTGFTLAEVLITLGIIGIVAAMTLPSLVGNYQKIIAANRLKQVYSELSQATQRSILDNGDTKDWDLSDPDRYLTPYYKGLTICQQVGDPVSKCGGGISASKPIYSTARGEAISFSGWSPGGGRPNALAVLVDVDGARGQKVQGKDLFYFHIVDNKVYPFGWHEGITRAEIINGYQFGISRLACKQTRTDPTESYRHACTALIMMDGWEIKDDYPWK